MFNNKPKQIKRRELNYETWLLYNIVVAWQHDMTENVLYKKLSGAGARKSIFNKNMIKLIARYYYNLQRLEQILQDDSFSELALFKGYSFLLTRNFPIFIIPVMLYATLLKGKIVTKNEFRKYFKELLEMYGELDLPRRVNDVVMRIMIYTYGAIPFVWSFQDSPNKSISISGKDISEKYTDITPLYTLEEIYDATKKN